MAVGNLIIRAGVAPNSTIGTLITRGLGISEVVLPTAVRGAIHTEARNESLVTQAKYERLHTEARWI